jgi:hypothetical protein
MFGFGAWGVNPAGLAHSRAAEGTFVFFVVGDEGLEPSTR